MADKMLIAQSEFADGTCVALIEDDRQQYVLTWRRDDADEWSVFSECTTGSITATEIVDFARTAIADFKE